MTAGATLDSAEPADLSGAGGMLDVMPSRPFSPVFVGRDAELALLEDALRRSERGQPGVVVVGGEAGVGKSRLLDEFAVRAGDRGARVLVGGCVELGEEGMPFAPFVAALRALLRELGDAGLDALLPGARAELVRLLPELELGARPDGSGGQPHAERGRGPLFEVMVELLERLGRERPVVVVLEDLHWADRSTRELLAFLARGLRSSAVLLVGTYRSDALHRGHPLRPFVAELDRVRNVDRVELARFDRAEVGAQLTGILGRPAEPGFVERVFDRSEGNAFFVEELVGCSTGNGEGTVTLTESLRDLLLARVDRLSGSAQQVLRVAAAGRRQVDYGLLAAVVEMSEDNLLAALREAVSNNVLSADGDGFSFRHSLLREVLHDDLLPGEHGRLHVRYAEALESQPGLVPADRVASELAHHWFAAGEPRRALTTALAAADEAGERYAYAEQRTMLERVLTLWDRVPDPVGLTGLDHLSLVEATVLAAMRAGDHDRALALNDLAIAESGRTVDPERAALLLERRGKLLRDLSREGGLGALREAEALLPADRPSRARAIVLSSLAGALMLKPLPAESVEVAEEALALARQLAEAKVEIRVLTILGADRIMLGDVDAGIACLDEAMALACSRGSDESVLRVRANYADTLLGLGRHQAAAAMAREGIERARAIGRARTIGAFLIGNLADPLAALGEWDEADRLVTTALSLDPPGVQSLALRQLRASIAIGRGRWDEAGEHLAVMRGTISRRYVGAQYHLPLAWATAELAVWRGEPQRALDTMRARLGKDSLPGIARYAWPLVAVAARAAADLARRAHDMHDPGAAIAAESEVAEVRASMAALEGGPGTVVAAWQATAEAELARAAGGSCVEGWMAAVAAWERAGEPYPLAYARFRLAEAAAEAGDRELLTNTLRRSAETADALHADPLRREIDLLAIRARVELVSARPVPIPDADAEAGAAAAGDAASSLGLTPREREVLRAVAAGQSNRQIAQELFISAKTASVHVSNILAKLGVSGRGEAAAVAHRLRLFDEAM